MALGRLWRSLALLLLITSAGVVAGRGEPPQHGHEHRGGGGEHGRDPHGHGQGHPLAPLPFTVDPNPSSYHPLPRRDTLIVHATVLDGAGRRFDDADVLVRDGKVARLGHALTVARAGLAVIDAHGRVLTPGVIDPHSHDGTYVVPLTSIDTHASDVSEISDPIEAQDWIQHAINVQDPAFSRALQHGVTTMMVLPGSDPVTSGRTVVLKPVPATTVDAMIFPGAPQGIKMACGENPKETFGALGRAPNSRQGELALLRAAFLRALDYVADWRDYETGVEDDRPHRDLALDALAAVLAGQARVHIHCYRSDEMGVMLDLAHEFGFRIAAFHHAVEGYKLPALLRDAGTCAVVWSDWWGYKMEALDGIRANAALIDAAGGCVAMHSDSPELGQWLNVEAGIAAAAGRRAGLPEPPEHVIRWITSGPATVLGLQDRIGTIAPGYDADLVLWSGDPFSVYTKADLVMIDGAVAFDRAHPPAQPASDFELGRTPVSAQP